MGLKRSGSDKLSGQIYCLWIYISLRRKKQLILLLIVMIIASFFEVMSIGAVIPFLGALTTPQTIFNHALAQPLIAILNIKQPKEILFPFTVLFIVAAIASAGGRLMLFWLQTRLGHAIGADLSIKIYEKTLHQPYQVHLSRNSSEVIAGISSKVGTVIYSTIMPLLTIFSAIFMLAVILAALIVIDSWMASVTLVGFGALYFLIILATKKKLIENSRKISWNSNQVIKALQEGLGGIRDVLIDGTQNTYSAIYREADNSLRRAQANNSIMGSAPRFFLEALGISLIAGTAYGISAREDGFAQAIPTLGALALGAQRLLPVMQQMYQSWSSLNGGQAPLRDVLDLISQSSPGCLSELPLNSLNFKNAIRLNNLSFQYSNHNSEVLSDLNFEIRRGSRVGFIGATGSGKSTLLDIIMGLLPPTKGTLEVDGIQITAKNHRAWQANITHVPQTIFLADISIAQNIAFGVPSERIDMSRVKRAANKAQIAEYIESLEDQYHTLVGERGVRLSGGQRQRIGIARALYKQASLIVFDEATSALDDETEASVMKAINEIDTDITVIIVAHRLSTLGKCDTVYELSRGKIVRSGALFPVGHPPAIPLAVQES